MQGDAVLPNPVDDETLTVALAAFLEHATLPPALVARKHPTSLAKPVVFLWVELGSHQADDPTCAELDRRLRASVRATDLICCLGSAGYAVRLAGAGWADAIRVADRLTRTLGIPVVAVTLHPSDPERATRPQIARRVALSPASDAREESALHSFSDAALAAPTG